MSNPTPTMSDQIFRVFIGTEPKDWPMSIVYLVASSLLLVT